MKYEEKKEITQKESKMIGRMIKKVMKQAQQYIKIHTQPFTVTQIN